MPEFGCPNWYTGLPNNLDTSLEMKVETIIIGTKINSVNEVLITIHLNSVARIKQTAISDTAFNIQSP